MRNQVKVIPIKEKLNPTNEECKSATEILRLGDPKSQTMLMYNTALALLLPILRLPNISWTDGAIIKAEDTFDAAWDAICRVMGRKNKRYMRVAEVQLLVRLLGYAQTGEFVAGMGDDDIDGLLRGGPLCRTYECGSQRDAFFFKKPSAREDELANNIMMEVNIFKSQGGSEREAIRDILLQSGLGHQTLDYIWKLAHHGHSILDKNFVVKMLRLITCAQLGRRLHARLYENPKPLPHLYATRRLPVNAEEYQSAPSTYEQGDSSILSPSPPFPVPQPSGTPEGTTVRPVSTEKSTMQPKMPLPPVPPKEPLSALTSPERTKYMAILNTHKPQGGSVSVNEYFDILVQEGFRPASLVPIWGILDKDSSGSLSRGNFVIARHLLELMHRGAMPQLPSELPSWLRDEAAQVDGAANELVEPIPVVMGDNAPGLGMPPKSMPAPRTPQNPLHPLSSLNGTNDVLPGRPPAMNDSPTPPAQDGPSEIYVNRPSSSSNYPPHAPSKPQHVIPAPPQVEEGDFITVTPSLPSASEKEKQEHTTQAAPPSSMGELAPTPQSSPPYLTQEQYLAHCLEYVLAARATPTVPPARKGESIKHAAPPPGTGKVRRPLPQPPHTGKEQHRTPPPPY